MPRRRLPGPPRQRERAEQALGVELLRSIGARVWILGTTRAKTCWKCGETTRDFSTRQTPGISDIFAVLPPRRLPALADIRPRSIWWEVKAPKDAATGARAGVASDEQIAFRDVVLGAGDCGHVLGSLDALYAYLVEGGWLKAENIPHYRRPDGIGQQAVRVAGAADEVAGTPPAGESNAGRVRRPRGGL